MTEDKMRAEPPALRFLYRSVVTVEEPLSVGRIAAASRRPPASSNSASAKVDGGLVTSASRGEAFQAVGVMIWCCASALPMMLDSCSTSEG